MNKQIKLILYKPCLLQIMEQTSYPNRWFLKSLLIQVSWFPSLKLLIPVCIYGSVKLHAPLIPHCYSYHIILMGNRLLKSSKCFCNSISEERFKCVVLFFVILRFVRFGLIPRVWLCGMGENTFYLHLCVASVIKSESLPVSHKELYLYPKK